jgi:HEAT repeat protein
MLATVLLALAVAADPATPAAEGSVRDQVMALVGAIDQPVPPETWRALPAGAEAVLAELAASAATLPTRRARALEGLSALGGGRAEQVHLDAARAADAPRMVRTAAVRGLGRMLPPDRLAREVAPLLADGDPRVQAVAADALARHAPAQGCGAVRAEAARGPEAARRFARAVDACGGR